MTGARENRRALRPVDDPNADDATGVDPVDVETLAANEEFRRRRAKRLKTLERKAHEAARKGCAPGTPIGSTKPGKQGKKISDDQKYKCSCGQVMKLGTHTQQMHEKSFPMMCRKRTNRPHAITSDT
jgi:hypothetical protein